MQSETSAPRKILFVVTEDYAFLMYRLPMARAAQDAGFEVHVAARVNASAEAIRAGGFHLHDIPFRRGGMSPFAAWPTIAALRRLTTDIRPDIIHNVGVQCCVIGSIAVFGKNVALVNALTGLGYVFSSEGKRARLAKAAIIALLPRLLNRKRSVALVQNPDDQEAIERLGVFRERIVLIPGSGVNTEILQPLPEPDGELTFGFVGRLLADKGIRALVAAHRILQDAGIKTRLLIAGNPDPANPASVTKEEAEQWGHQPGIAWLGHVNDISGFWRRCHVAVLPSHREGLPMSLMEAAACGRPLIATDVPGCREIVIENETGLRVPVEDSGALADAMAKLARSHELRARFGHAARRLVEQKLSGLVVGHAVVTMYEELLASRHASDARPQAINSPK